MKTKAWISAMRLRTLPLAASCIIMGSALAAWEGFWNTWIFILALSTTLLLQILSNLANDYGDGVKGTDNAGRVGPMRAIQSGIISPTEMKIGMIVCGVAALACGLGMLYMAFSGQFSFGFWALFALGLLAIAAAVKYTVGNFAYGYRGMGDLFVFLFFGWVGVLGSHFLLSGVVNWSLLLPATSVGLFSVAVLNLNNMRDHVNDALASKRTLVVILGFPKAKFYHYSILLVGWLCMLGFALLHFESYWHYLFLLALPVFVMDVLWVRRTQQPQLLDPELKKVALGTFFFSLLIALGQWMG